jgi:hypothetical protein
VPAQEPYYNPANLENDGSHVKQKEFVQRIGIFAESAATPNFGGGAALRDFFIGIASLGSAGVSDTKANG